MTETSTTAMSSPPPIERRWSCSALILVAAVANLNLDLADVA
ncbi:MAG TPA: hypothetical protein VFP08_11640 [Acidimicrobiales bacterium]|nr:hypothetical protein [Acidimicrobiales bacterium]